MLINIEDSAVVGNLEMLFETEYGKTYGNIWDLYTLSINSNELVSEILFKLIDSRYFLGLEFYQKGRNVKTDKE